jgi:hypothetical protein
MVERIDHRFQLAAAKRHHESSGALQIGTDADFGDRQADPGQVGVAQLAARENVGKGVAQLLTDAQLALAAALSGSLLRSPLCGGLCTPPGAS